LNHDNYMQKFVFKLLYITITSPSGLVICSIPTKQISRIYFLTYIFNLIIQTIGYNDVALFFEAIKLIHNEYTFEFRFFQTWLIDNYFYILLFYSFDNPLDSGLSKVIRSCLHC